MSKRKIHKPVVEGSRSDWEYERAVWLAKLDEVKQMLRREERLEAAGRVGWAIRMLKNAPEPKP